MMICAYKIVVDPVTFDEHLIFVTDNPRVALDGLMAIDAHFEVAMTRPDVPWYGMKLTGIYLLVSKGAQNLVKAFPPMRPTEMSLKEWGYASTLKNMP